MSAFEKCPHCGAWKKRSELVNHIGACTIYQQPRRSEGENIADPGGISGENGGNIMAKKKKTSIMLTAKDKRLLELLAEKENRSQTKELEYLIRRRAEELELKIEGHNYYN